MIGSAPFRSHRFGKKNLAGSPHLEDYAPTMAASGLPKAQSQKEPIVLGIVLGIVLAAIFCFKSMESIENR